MFDLRSAFGGAAMAGALALLMSACGRDPLSEAASRRPAPSAAAVGGVWQIDPESLEDAGFNGALRLVRSEGMILGSRDMGTVAATLAQRYEINPPKLTFGDDGRASFDALGCEFSGTWSIKGREIVVVDSTGAEHFFVLTKAGLESDPGRTSHRVVRFVRPQGP